MPSCSGPRFPQISSTLSPLSQVGSYLLGTLYLFLVESTDKIQECVNMYISDKQQIRFRISLSHALYEVNLCHTRKDAFFSEVSVFRRLVLHLLSMVAAFLGASLSPPIVKHDPGARREANSLTDPFLPHSCHSLCFWAINHPPQALPRSDFQFLNAGRTSLFLGPSSLSLSFPLWKRG